MSRNEEILEMYKGGKTLEQLGVQFKITRARVQQIVMKQIEKEILESNQLGRLTREERDLLRFAAKQEVEKIVEYRKVTVADKTTRENSDRIHEKLRSLANPLMFVTVADLARALNETPENLKEFAPDITSSIVSNAKRRWSRLYLKCRGCLTTTWKHRSYGYCVKCWPKTEMFKQSQKNSFIRNIDKRKAHTKEYLKGYYQRPEVVERIKQRHDREAFGGNREEALKRDLYMCQLCGVGRSVAKNKTGKDLFVVHVGDKHDHSLSNLRTACQSCHARNFSAKGLAKIKFLNERRKMPK